MSAISSLTSVLEMVFDSPPVRASIVPLDDAGEEITNQQNSPVPDSGFAAAAAAMGGPATIAGPTIEKGFQYFPETINDNRSVNWASKQIPGGSHPLYQWTGGGDRTLSFTAMFTADEDPGTGGLIDLLTTGVSLSSVLGFSKKHVVNVAAAVAWLRSYTYPTYKDGYAKPPPVLRLYLPRSGIYGLQNGALTPNSINVVMTQCDVLYEAFFRNGHPRLAAVSLGFVEMLQVGTNWKFVDRKDWDTTTKWSDGYTVPKERPDEAPSEGGGGIKEFIFGA